MRRLANINSITSIATEIAAQLGETHAGERATIWCAVRTLGTERAHAFVAQALEVEANGGMLVPDGSRRCTLGDIFFYLVHAQVSDDEAMQINPGWRGQGWKKRKQPNVTNAASAPPTLLPFVWEEAAPIIAEITANVGEAVVPLNIVDNSATLVGANLPVFSC